MPVGECHMSPFSSIFLRGFPGLRHGIMRPARFLYALCWRRNAGLCRLRLQFAENQRISDSRHARGPGKIEGQERALGIPQQIASCTIYAKSASCPGAEFRVSSSSARENIGGQKILNSYPAVVYSPRKQVPVAAKCVCSMTGFSYQLFPGVLVPENQGILWLVETHGAACCEILANSRPAACAATPDREFVRLVAPTARTSSPLLTCQQIDCKTFLKTARRVYSLFA